MYTTINFKTKKQLKDTVASGQKVSYYQPGLFGDFCLPEITMNGTIYVEGPHYPEPHKWYASCTVKDGFIVKVK